MKRLIISHIFLFALISCSRGILGKISASQSQYFSKEKIGDVPNDMLNSLNKARTALFESKLRQYDDLGDTLFLIEGFSIETGMTYSVIWSSKFKSVNYKTHFGNNLEVVKTNLFDESTMTAVSSLEFDRLKRETSVLDGNLYIASVIIQSNKKIDSISHKVFEEPRWRGSPDP
jgi:hypothetical protein